MTAQCTQSQQVMQQEGNRISHCLEGHEGVLLGSSCCTCKRFRKAVAPHCKQLSCKHSRAEGKQCSAGHMGWLAGQGQTEHGGLDCRGGQCRVGQGSVRQDGMRQSRANRCRTGHGRAQRGKAGQGRAGQGIPAKPLCMQAANTWSGS